jgi:hypothetical protein
MAGDCLVPTHYIEDPSLGTWVARWVARQQRVYANNKLWSDHRSKLESIGFVWVAGKSLTAHEKQAMGGNVCNAQSSRNTIDSMGTA